MRITRIIPGVICLFVLAVCLAPSRGSWGVVQGQTNTRSKSSPQRIIALTSLSADIVRNLDRSKLVGISGSSILNNNPNFNQIPKVSEGRVQPDLEKILSLKPDLVIGAKGFHEQTATTLSQLGIATELIDVDSWEMLEKVTKDLAIKLGSNPERLLNQYRALAVKKPPISPRVLVLVSRQPMLSPNKESWAGAMLDRFHLKNVVADLQGKAPFEGYITLSAEKLLQLNPDVLIVVETGEGILQQFQAQSFWRNLQAVQKGKVYQFDYYGLVNPGSIDAIVKASEKLKEIVNGK